MSSSFVLLAVVLVVVSICLILIFRILNSKDNNQLQFDQLNSQFARLDNSMREEFARNREENLRNAKDSREETLSTLKTFSEIISKTITDVGKLQKDQLEAFALQLKNSHEQQAINDRANRDEQKNSLKSFEDKFTLNVKDFNELQRQKLDSMMQQLDKIR